MNDQKQLKLAIMGIRGIPANYGGFETMAEELAPRLVQRGHSVTVYGRSNMIKHPHKYYKGVRLKVLPTINHKYLDTVFHTFLCVLDTFRDRYDAILICNAANSLFAFLPRLTGQKVLVNVDGIERLRKKWNWLGRTWYLMGEKFSTLFPNRIISDAKVIQDYYKERYGADSILIPYGAEVGKVESQGALKKFGLTAGKYVLFVSRLEPENNAHLVIEAFERVQTDLNLVIVGDAPYSEDYIRSLKATRDPRIVFTGYVFGDGYKELQSHSFCYVHATEVGGTHPALIEAMGFGNCVISNGTPENIEVLGGTGIIYKKNDPADLAAKLNQVLDSPELIQSCAEAAQKRVETTYRWPVVVSAYEKTFLDFFKDKE